MISAIILTKNDEGDIQSVLANLSWIDECIVIDNGSTDETLALVKGKNVRTAVIPSQDFALLRNRGAELAKGSWLLYIDTDEEVTDELKAEILSVTASFNKDMNPHAYVIKRKNYYLGTSWPFSDGMIRLIYKASLDKWVGKLHETASINGSVGILSHQLIHNTHRTLESMLDKTNEWSAIEADLRITHHHPPIKSWRIFRVMLTGFFDSFIRQGGWKAGTAGIIESIYQGFSMFVTYAKVWERQQKIIAEK